MNGDTNKNFIKQKSGHIYKDTLFRTLFREKNRAIELCNAVTGTNYPEDVPITMYNMENTLLKRYNELAVAIKGQLIVMFEHQSTINPNMPLRSLPYITDALYLNFIDSNEI